MYLPKKDVYNALKTLNVGVSQTQPTTFNELPFINFEVTDNNLNLFLDNSIASQYIEVKIDIWANSSVEASNLLSRVEEVMRQDLYLMTFSADIPNIGNIFHISTRFSKQIG